MAAVIICSDIGAPKIKPLTFSIVSPSICHEVMGPKAMTFIFWMWSLSQMFHSPLSLPSRGPLAPLHFLPWGWCYLHIWGYWCFSHPSWFQFVLHPVGHFSWCILHVSQVIRVTIYSLYILLSWWNLSVVPCWVLAIASRPAYRFLRSQIRWSGIPVSVGFPQFVVIHSVKGVA